jgi:hypothetical protein
VFFGAPGRVSERGTDVILLQVRKVGEDFLVRLAGSEQADDGADSDPHAAKAWFTAHDIRRVSDTAQQVFHEVDCTRAGLPVEVAARISQETAYCGQRGWVSAPGRTLLHREAGRSLTGTVGLATFRHESRSS